MPRHEILLSLSLAVLFALAPASPLLLTSRQSAAAAAADPCFVIGTTPLPQEVIDTDTAIASRITCSTTATTIGTVPDVTSGAVSFSSINFAASQDTPLQFALTTFATASPLASSDLATFTAQQDVYEATEAGLRSTCGSLAIKVPKFFLSFQIARIKTAQGTAITDPGQTVEHLLGKVTKNAAGESQELLDQVTALATQLA